MREKFIEKITPDYIEMAFINKMEHTHDTYGISERTLSLILGVSKRKLRKYKERYNNFKYIDIVPKGKIVTIKKLYRLITVDSIYAQRIIKKTNYDLICAAIDKHNTIKILGSEQVQGQLSLYDIHKMSYNELLKLGNKIDQELKESN